MKKKVTLADKLIAKAQRAIVAYYHLCTDYDDWGTCDEHWLQVVSESPAEGYINRWFVRVKNTKRFKRRTMAHHLISHSRGTMCVTFFRGEITEVGWHRKPDGRHANPLDNYQHRHDAQREQELADKPTGYGEWA